MLPIRFKYLEPIIKKKSKINFEKIENSKQNKNALVQSKNGFLTRHHTKKTKKMITQRLKSTEQKLRSRRIHTHTHTHTRTHARTHAHTHIHTDIFQKSCILIPNTSENNYNMFLQQLKKLLSQSFLQQEAINLRKS